MLEENKEVIVKYEKPPENKERMELLKLKRRIEMMEIKLEIMEEMYDKHKILFEEFLVTMTETMCRVSDKYIAVCYGGHPNGE